MAIYQSKPNLLFLWISIIVLVFPILLVFYEATTYLSNDMYLPALPQIARELGIGNHQAQLTLTLWFLGTASMQLLLGPLSDRYGRRAVLLSGGLVFVAASAACALTHDITLLLLARFAQGCAVCSVVVAGYSAIHEIYAHKQSVRILALMGSITVLAPAFGPLLGGLILTIAHWRAIFWLITGMAVFALLLLSIWMPESNPQATRQPLVIKILLKGYLNILCNKRFLINAMPFCLNFSAIIAWIAMGPFLVIDTFHYSPLIFGIFQIAVFGSFIAGSFYVKYAMDFHTLEGLINRGLVIALSGGIASLLSAFLFPHTIVIFIVPLMVYAGGAALAFGPMQRLAIEACQEPMGIRMAMFSSLMCIFAVIGSAMASLFYNGELYGLAGFIFLVTASAFFIKKMKLFVKA